MEFNVRTYATKRGECRSDAVFLRVYKNITKFFKGKEQIFLLNLLNYEACQLRVGIIGSTWICLENMLGYIATLKNEEIIFNSNSQLL